MDQLYETYDEKCPHCDKAGRPIKSALLTQGGKLIYYWTCCRRIVKKTEWEHFWQRLKDGIKAVEESDDITSKARPGQAVLL